MRHISKLAKMISNTKDEALSLWNPAAGPFENILNVAPLAPDLYKDKNIIDAMNSAGVGKWLDFVLQLGPKSDVGTREIDKATSALQNIESRAAIENDIVKTAFIGGILKLLGLISLVGGIGKIKDILSSSVKWILGIFGAASIAGIAYSYFSSQSEEGKGEKKDDKKNEINPLKLLKFIEESAKGA